MYMSLRPKPITIALIARKNVVIYCNKLRLGQQDKNSISSAGTKQKRKIKSSGVRYQDFEFDTISIR